ncbi:tripartite motif-containing protein 75-like [Suncus etruscus]|uniref:tripartite motif-containing protein 75-like n=1 Tax=Suncus etruscus TaxID=109475 RepID=UPI00210F6574|nr:tripartite motif-containing protein 75-like [Suncus etruscus]
MALAAFLAELRTEARCPLCQAFLQEPVTLECGHNYCGSCLQQRWEHLQDILPCPVCLHPCTDGHPQKNRQLGHMADLVQEILCMRVKNSEEEQEEEEGRGHCERHQQVLNLFCEDDLELLCGQCAASPNHQAHVLTPIEEAAAHHRQRLKSCLEHLRKQLQEAERALERQVSESEELREMLAEEMNDFALESKEFKCFLEDEQKIIENKVLRELEEVSRNVLKGQRKLSEQASTLKTLLIDIRRLQLQTDLGLLQGIRFVHWQWKKCGGVELPESLTHEPMEKIRTFPPHYAGLHNLKSKFQRDLILDPETTHPNLIVSEDQSKVYVFDKSVGESTAAPHPKAFTFHQAVLGAEPIERGRHFWEIAFQGSVIWSIGVCKESFPRNSQVPPSPANGCWQFKLLPGIHLDECSPSLAKLSAKFTVP